MDATVPADTSQQQRFFRSRYLLILALFCSVPCGLLAVNIHRSWKQSAAVKAILEYPGCEVFYEGHDSLSALELYFLTDRDPVRGILHARAEYSFGPNFVPRVVTVEVDSDHFFDVIRHLSQLPSLKLVFIRNPCDDQTEDILTATKQLEREIPGVEVIQVRFVNDTAENATMTMVDLTRIGLRFLAPASLVILADRIETRTQNGMLLGELELWSGSSIVCAFPLPAFLDTDAHPYTVSLPEESEERGALTTAPH